MVKLALQLKAELNNVTDLVPADAEHNWFFKIQCNSCNEIGENAVSISASDNAQISGSRGEANLVMRCKFCKREGSASIVSGPQPYTQDDSMQEKKILVLECRGIEPVQFEPRDGWVAKGAESSTRFEVDLSENEWYEYDEEAAVDVSITEMSFSIVHA
ncbi:hypothetical protein GGI07_002412 [Coemansia sp. Benny D115]|nr:hypothetical protein GGI07_002412 [Coemansia sp. Benny D115]